jgi:hypothetical protein
VAAWKQVHQQGPASFPCNRTPGVPQRNLDKWRSRNFCPNCSLIRRPCGLQCQKLDPNREGEPYLSNGKFTAFLTDDNNVNFKSGRTIWCEGRFRKCPGRVGHAQYEHMCNKLRETSQWSEAKPVSKFAPGFAEYTTRSPEQTAKLQVCAAADVERCRQKARVPQSAVDTLPWHSRAPRKRHRDAATHTARHPGDPSSGLTRKHAVQAAQMPAPPAPEGGASIREADGTVTHVPETGAVAQGFGALRLVPAARGEVPNGPAQFSVHTTPTADLRWLTRVVTQRTASNVPVRGPGSVVFFESCGRRGGTLVSTATAAS